MEIREKLTEELEARKLEISELINHEDADLDALEEEVRAINAELERRIAVEKEKAEERKRVAEATDLPKTEENPMEERKMTNKEIRSSKEYLDTYVRYLKGEEGAEAECRSLLTENVEGGTVPVPTYVADKIQTSWEQDGIMSRVLKTYLPGNVKTSVEMAASPAAVHIEGAEAPAEEEITFANVDISAHNIKKWITISDEVMELRGEAFLDYIYDEFKYQITKKAAAEVLAAIAAAPSSGTEAPTVAHLVSETPGLDDVVQAIGKLKVDSDELVFIASRQTIAAYKAVAMAANYAQDIFDGCTVIPCAAAGEAAYVGDLRSVQANFPNGVDIKFTFDPYTLSEDDLVKVTGKLFAGIGLIRDGAFCIIAAE